MKNEHEPLGADILLGLAFGLGLPAVLALCAVAACIRSIL